MLCADNYLLSIKSKSERCPKNVQLRNKIILWPFKHCQFSESWIPEWIARGARRLRGTANHQNIPGQGRKEKANRRNKQTTAFGRSAPRTYGNWPRGLRHFSYLLKMTARSPLPFPKDQSVNYIVYAKKRMWVAPVAPSRIAYAFRSWCSSIFEREASAP